MPLAADRYTTALPSSIEIQSTKTSKSGKSSDRSEKSKGKSQSELTEETETNIESATNVENDERSVSESATGSESATKTGTETSVNDTSSITDTDITGTATSVTGTTTMVKTEYSENPNTNNNNNKILKGQVSDEDDDSSSSSASDSATETNADSESDSNLNSDEESETNFDETEVTETEHSDQGSQKSVDSQSQIEDKAQVSDNDSLLEGQQSEITGVTGILADDEQTNIGEKIDGDYSENNDDDQDIAEEDKVDDVDNDADDDNDDDADADNDSQATLKPKGPRVIPENTSLGFKLIFNRARDERYITEIIPGSRAEAADLQVGDRILGVNGQLLYGTHISYMRELIKKSIENLKNIELFAISKDGFERFRQCHIRPRYEHIEMPAPRIIPMTIDELEELQAKEEAGEVVYPPDKYTMDEVDERGAFPNLMLDRAVDVVTPESVDPYDYTIMNLGQLSDLVTASREPKKIENDGWENAINEFEEL